MNSDLYKSYYLDEWSRRSEIEATLSIPIGALTVLGGALFVTGSMVSAAWNVTNTILLLLIGITLIPYSRAVYFIVKSVHGYTYERIPTSLELGVYFQELLNYHSATGGQARDAHKDFEEYLNARYAEATERNAWNNVSKAEFRHRANHSLIYVLVFAALAGVPALVNRYHHPVEPQRIAIVNLDALAASLENAMPENQEAHSPSPSPAKPQQPSEGQPPKPQGPPNHEIREGEQPSKKR